MSETQEGIIESPSIYIETKDGFYRSAVIYRGRKMLPSTAKRMMELRPHVVSIASKGMSLRQGATKLGYSKQCLINYLKIMQVKWTPAKAGGHRLVVDKTGWWELIHKAAADGDSLESLGDRLGVHPMNLWRFCKRHNIPWKKIRTYGKKV
jgi:hypothetical protein